MKEIIGINNKAADAFTHVLVEEVSATREVKEYTFRAFVLYYRKMIEEYPIIQMCTISLTKTHVVGERVYPDNKFIIRILMLDKDGRPIATDKEDEYVGTMVIASSIDTKLQNFMDGKNKKTIKRMEKEKV